MRIQEMIRQFIIDELLYGDSKKLTDETQLLDEGVFDSLGILRMIEFIESQFDVKVDAEDINKRNFRSIDAIVDFVDDSTI